MPNPDPPATVGEGMGPTPTVSVPEIRDYGRINPEIVRLLNEGHRQVRLTGVQGQRLLAAGLKGTWGAEIVLEGDAGPELAANLDAPGLSIICLGSAADGAGSGMKAGQLLVLGHAGDALGYEQAEGAIFAASSAGNRAGLRQSGGRIALGGSTGRLAADRQSGGILYYVPESPGPYLGHGRTGGRVVQFGEATIDEISNLRKYSLPIRSWLSQPLKDLIWSKRAFDR